VREAKHTLLRASARRITAVILLVALYLAFRAETGGGLQAGALAALAFVMHTLIFGAGATLAAVPFAALRIAMAAGLCVLIAGTAAPGAIAGRLASEFGLFVTAAASFALAFAAIAGRAHELRDGEW
jgi:multicomponent Na+:H+ antiporter subunit B